MFQSIWVLLAFALQNDILLHQLDVVLAFLNSTLEEDVNMQHPDSYHQQRKEHLVCKLKKYLYGLKQCPRWWKKVPSEFLTYVNFEQSWAFPWIYVLGDDCPIVVAAYVDDFIIATKTVEEMQQVKPLLQARFEQWWRIWESCTAAWESLSHTQLENHLNCIRSSTLRRCWRNTSLKTSSSGRSRKFERGFWLLEIINYN